MTRPLFDQLLNNIDTSGSKAEKFFFRPLQIYSHAISGGKIPKLSANVVILKTSHFRKRKYNTLNVVKWFLGNSLTINPVP